jgi:hypothetical protein
VTSTSIVGCEVVVIDLTAQFGHRALVEVNVVLGRPRREEHGWWHAAV